MSELHRLANVLNEWTEDSLTDCVCLVGYTANTWSRGNVENNLSLNVQWIVVLDLLT